MIALVFGGLLAVLVVFVFIRRFRPTMIVAAAIPLSLIAAVRDDLGVRLHAQTR
jgi:multidrug efflux pump subunit AcrB